MVCRNQPSNNQKVNRDGRDGEIVMLNDGSAACACVLEEGLKYGYSSVVLVLIMAACLTQTGLFSWTPRIPRGCQSCEKQVEFQECGDCNSLSSCIWKTKEYPKLGAFYGPSNWSSLGCQNYCSYADNSTRSGETETAGWRAVPGKQILFTKTRSFLN